VFVSFSGGKDSTAAWLWMLENGIQVRVVFADTGWEHPDTYAYVDAMEKRFGPIARVGYPGGMRKLVREHASFPKKHQRFCTAELKRIPLAVWMTAEARRLGGSEAISVTGLRRDESAARANLLPWEITTTKIPGKWAADGEPYQTVEWSYRPLLDWKLADVVAIHQRHGVRPNPLYLRGFSRVGCFPCINAAKGEIAGVADQSPGVIEEIRALEAELTKAYAARGGSQELSYFDKPIDRKVAWSRTARGGANTMLGLEDPNSDGGCGTWGLCESGDEGFPV
jgi:3'-phosphoadenosine 5'-phosphosulfate sulfotransferase (PAPS reductase)/FAD synthetase